MSAPSDRRGFLRNLASLPLIGGSVALVGRPTAAAVPVTPGMLATYAAWLHFEQRALSAGTGTRGLVPELNPGSQFHRWSYPGLEGRAAIARAPVILAAAGCELTSPEAEEAWSTTFVAGPR